MFINNYLNVFNTCLLKSKGLIQAKLEFGHQLPYLWLWELPNSRIISLMQNGWLFVFMQWLVF